MRLPNYIVNILRNRGNDMITDEGALKMMMERYEKAIKLQDTTAEVAWQMVMSSIELDDQVRARKERDVKNAERKKHREEHPEEYVNVNDKMCESDG